MWCNDEAVRIVEGEDQQGTPTRKKVYLSHIAFDDEDNYEGETDDSHRQQLLQDFEDATGTTIPAESTFKSLLNEIHDEEIEDEEDGRLSEVYRLLDKRCAGRQPWCSWACCDLGTGATPRRCPHSSEVWSTSGNRERLQKGRPFSYSLG